MKVLDNYVFETRKKTRYVGTTFLPGDDEYLGRSHGYSYVMARKGYQELGERMGFEREEDIFTKQSNYYKGGLKNE